MTLKKSITRSARAAIKAVASPSKSLGKLEQGRQIARGRETFLATGLEQRLRSILPAAFSPKYDDLYRLWDTVRTMRPKLVVEYGSGCSTIVMAAALKQNADEGHAAGHLVSIEGYREWLDHTRSHLTDEERSLVDLRELHPVVTTRRLKINLAGSVVWYSVHAGKDVEQGIVGLSYPDIASLSPEMIYLDGPDPKSVPGYVDSRGMVFPPIVFDPLDMEDHLPPNAVIVVDGRPSNAMVLRNNFSTRWKTEILGEQKCTVFRRAG